MGIPFKELAGSPEKSWSKEGFKATRKVLVLADQEMDFVRAILAGRSGGLGIAPPCLFPNFPGVYALDIKSKLFNGAPDPGVFTDFGLDINTYSGKWIEISVDYGLLPESEEQQPEQPEDQGGGVILSYTMDIDAEYIALPGRSCTWDSYPTLEVADDVHPTVRASIITHNLTFSRAQNPPWSEIRANVGCVNDNQHELETPVPGTFLNWAGRIVFVAMWHRRAGPTNVSLKFLGAEAETVLCVGAKGEKEFYGVNDFNEATYGWKLSYVFKERRLTGMFGSSGEVAEGKRVGLHPVTWNDFWVPERHCWDKLITSGTDGVYQKADLFNLFNFTAIPAQ
jgi:hypothetical protein